MLYRITRHTALTSAHRPRLIESTHTTTILTRRDELAAYLTVGKRTLYRLVAQEEIPAFKVGGTWRFRRSDIDRWIEDRSPTETRKGGDARR
ncbi:helix-turn-helix domain-containing protein [Pseudomonas sp. WS 5018]|uniref:helix-turn-helix domain-containing protein n=1 Tax=Stutzerimonas stutzeri TaxID=316 RepID=UPI0014748A65|nr:helix-turn-helix domain-containing protein [Pseudomonas sp. WS 5018]